VFKNFYSFPVLQCLTCLGLYSGIVSPDYKTVKYTHDSPDIYHDCPDKLFSFECEVSQFVTEVKANG